ncbi:MAG: alpha/beta fold hydrolase [Actinomycetota bacterium]|nr:alpha/beta fold hydrolase [Actinomycetota bacterium]
MSQNASKMRRLRHKRHHEVLAPTLLGHAGGPPLDGEVSGAVIVDAIERAMDDAGFESAHMVGNSLGGQVALRLAARGRAESVVAFAPAGGWAKGDESFKKLLGFQATMHDQVKAGAPHAQAIVASAEGRRRATRLSTTNFEQLAHQMLGVASCTGAASMIEYGLREGYSSLDAEKITCSRRRS